MGARMAAETEVGDANAIATVSKEVVHCHTTFELIHN